MALEKLNFNIPAGSKWKTVDVEKKAKEMGLQNKSEFMIMAIDTFMNFDDDFIKMMIDRTASLHIPLYVAIQNTIIAQSARILAKDKVFGGMVVKREEFPMFSDESGWHMLTGKALEEYLIDLYVKEFEQAKKDQNAAD